MPARCPHCSEPALPGAKFCPRCGQASPNGQSPPPVPPSERPHASVDFNKISAPLPPMGIAFLLMLVLGPAAILVGVVMGVKLLIYVGIALLIGLVLLLVLGEFF